MVSFASTPLKLAPVELEAAAAADVEAALVNIAARGFADEEEFENELEEDVASFFSFEIIDAMSVSLPVAGGPDEAE